MKNQSNFNIKKVAAVILLIFSTLNNWTYSQADILKGKQTYRKAVDTSNVKIIDKVDVDIKDKTTLFQNITTAVAWVGTIGNLIAIFFLYRTAKIATEQIKAQKEIAKSNLESDWKILRLSTNTNITNGLHLQLMDNHEFLRFHNTSANDIEACELKVKEFVYILNNILASEFYYDDFTSAQLIIEDFSHYRMQFLNQKEIEDVWNKIIKRNWSMAPNFVEAVDMFYLNREFYINRSQGTAV